VDAGAGVNFKTIENTLRAVGFSASVGIARVPR
jgi:hypothetical protein